MNINDFEFRSSSDIKYKCFKPVSFKNSLFFIFNIFKFGQKVFLPSGFYLTLSKLSNLKNESFRSDLLRLMNKVRFIYFKLKI